MSVYEVSVRFFSIRDEDFFSSLDSQLPNNLQLAGLKIIREQDGVYLATVEIEAEDELKAKIIAVRRVEDLLALFATLNDGFQVNHLNVTSRILSGQSGENKIHLKDYLALRKERVNVELESVAYKRREEWPQWLETALRLNYLALLSHKVPAFIIQFSALEVITEALVGAPEIIFDVEKRESKATVLKEVEQVFSKYGFSGNGVDRFMQRIIETRSKSDAERIAEALGKLGIKAEKVEIQRVRTRRSAIVHTGYTTDVGGLQTASELCRIWVQNALRNFITKNFVELEQPLQQS